MQESGVRSQEEEGRRKKEEKERRVVEVYGIFVS
jgi:hypothetical protein